MVGESVLLRVTHGDYRTETRYVELGSTGLDSIRVVLHAITDRPDGMVDAP